MQKYIVMSFKNSKKIVVTLILLSFVVLFSNFQTIISNVFSNKADKAEFINYETAHCHPIDITPDGTKLLAVNTANYSLEVFDLTQSSLQQIATIPVGVDPVTVRARTNTEAWVVNSISDNISIVDLSTNLVTKTIEVANEPWDVVFAGTPEKAYVSSAEPSILSIYNMVNLNAAPITHKVIGEDLRALAVSNDGQTIYGAFFESGNQSTVVNGDLGSETNNFAPDISSEVHLGPYGNVKVPPNNGNNFNPPLGSAGMPDHAKSLPVKKNANGRWMDDNGGDWTNVISGGDGIRVNGWDLPDRDIVVFDIGTNTVNYHHHMGNMLMAMDVHPTNNEIFVVGTDGINEVRFEPVLNGKFLRVNVSKFAVGASSQTTDLNPHLDYQTSSAPVTERLKSLGDPRGIKWLSDGSKAYVTGMGSNNVITIDANGNRLNTLPIEVGEGPTGIALNESTNKAYILNKFEGSISVIDVQSDCEVERLAYYDPTPTVIKNGRKFLYDTHFSSGTGHVACASCHIDAKYDRLAWDLGNPAGEMEDYAPTVVNFDFGNASKKIHPLKGLMVTTSLLDIIKPNTLLHWRGDRASLHEFAPAFTHLQGRDAEPTNTEMQQFADFLAETYYAPNPNRNLDNTFKTALELPAPYDQTPLVGDALQGLNDYLTTTGLQECIKCHEPNTGRGDLTRLTLTPHRMPAGFRGNYDQTGFWKFSQDGSTSGFGFFSDGVLDSRFKFFENDFGTTRLDALVYSFEGSDLNAPPNEVVHFSQDSHAAVGKQVTVNGPYAGNQQARLAELKSIAEQSGRISLIVSTLYQSETRQLFYTDSNTYQSDKAAQTLSHTELVNNALAGNPTTWTVVFDQVKERTSVDKNNNGIYDREELIANFTSERTLPYDMAALVNFDASSTYEVFGNTLNYTWTFGDGNSANGLNLTHSYSAPGVYTVTLTVTDPVTGVTNSINRDVEITPGCAALVGTTCTDQCYIGGTIQPDCSCSGIKTVDSDFDGLCDNIDTCPNFDNNLIGTACDDNDPCTSNDIWRSTCNCLGDVADLDADGVCDFYDLDSDNDGITNGTELACGQAQAQRTNLSTSAGNQFVNGNFTVGQALATFEVDNSDASLSTSSSYHFDGAGISYNFRDQNTNFNSIITISPKGNSILNKVSWGPDLMNINNSRYDNNSQTITLNWNLGFSAIVHDPNNQLTNTNGSVISSGASITQTTNQNNGAGTWYIEWDLSTSTSDFILNINHNDGSNLEFEGYSFTADLCVLQDTDNDSVYDHLDTDSDNDGCIDAIEGTNNYDYTVITNDAISGGVNSDGIPLLVGSNGQGVGNSKNDLVTSTNCCFMQISISGTDQQYYQIADGTASVNITSSGSAPYTYLWSDGQTTTSATNLAPGYYSITVTDATGCSATDSININALNCSTLVITSTINDESFYGFNDGTASVSINGGASPYTYNWSNGAQANSISNLSSGTYTVDVTDAVGCALTESILINAAGCTQNLIHNGQAAINTGVYQVADYIQSNGIVDNGINVSYKAGQYIELINDFEVKLNSDFEAIIDGCQ